MSVLDIWTVYDHPADFPDGFVARLWAIGPGGEPLATRHIVLGATLEAVRALLPRGLDCLPRQPGDDPCIVECWL